MGENCVDGCFCWVIVDEDEYCFPGPVRTEEWRPCPPSLCEKANHSVKKKSSMYLEDTTGMSPRAIRDKVNGFRKD